MGFFENGATFKIPSESFLTLKADKETLDIVFDGIIWYHDKHNKSLEEKIYSRLLIGSTYPNQKSYYADSSFFIGEISELNMWNLALSTKILTDITSDCGNPHFLPEILNWKEIKTSMLSGKMFDKDILQLCFNSDEAPTIYRVMPYLKNQEDAVQTCQILGGKLVFPRTKNEFKEWQSKFLKGSISIQYSYPPQLPGGQENSETTISNQSIFQTVLNVNHLSFYHKS